MSGKAWCICSLARVQTAYQRWKDCADCHSRLLHGLATEYRLNKVYETASVFLEGKRLRDKHWDSLGVALGDPAVG
jgi:hypothetical protein